MKGVSDELVGLQSK